MHLNADKLIKLPYEDPLMTILITDDKDVITTSDQGGTGDGGETPGGGNDWTGEWDTDF